MFVVPWGHDVTGRGFVAADAALFDDVDCWSARRWRHFTTPPAGDEVRASDANWPTTVFLLLTDRTEMPTNAWRNSYYEMYRSVIIASPASCDLDPVSFPVQRTTTAKQRWVRTASWSLCDVALMRQLFAFVCLLAGRVDFRKIRRIGGDSGPEKSCRILEVILTYSEHVIVFINSPLLMWKWKWRWENQLRRIGGKFRPMYVVDNDTVPISVQRGGGMRCTEYWCSSFVYLRLHVPVICWYYHCNWTSWLYLSLRHLFLANVNLRLSSLYAIAIPSVVCLSVCNVGALYSAGWNFRQFFSPYDSSWTLVFWCQNSLVGDAHFPLKFAFKVTHQTFKQRHFDQYRLIVPQSW